eukprot:CAMPEP_0119355220 /NCGR_PEP_ID=MMETSP1334-20130426/4078_1 /TAXON_ID=127549 /ORGANISM="Calcidiscus leptoporus, Strain RCC1130" /LENGTH=307 /DNA_ID=CAMNT_0007368975 /DNA_START=384 /DNA_END=1307 /DNA_ORIENTATION=-
MPLEGGACWPARTAQRWSLEEIATECENAILHNASSSSNAVMAYAHPAPFTGYFGSGPSQASAASSAHASAATEGLFQHATVHEAPSSTSSASNGQLPVPLVRTRACHPRAGWSTSEDELVIDTVKQHGKKWGVIAELLPGRSHAAVRNRWSRLLEERSRLPEEQGHVVEQSHTSTHSNPELLGDTDSSMSSEASDDHYKWRQDEDVLIVSFVQEYGRKWRKIAIQLPGRSEQAIRNRYYRLSTRAQSLTTHGCWSKVEDARIMASVAEIGHKWTVISHRYLPHRSEDAIRNRYTRLQRAQARNSMP